MGGGVKDMRVTKTVLAFILVVGAASCASMRDDISVPAGLPPADVAGIVMTANEGEVQQGQAAASKASSADVRSFAQMMVSDHTNALNMARDTFTKAGVTPAENATTQCLRENSRGTITNLGTYSGAAFDRAYMQSQVDIHQWLLTAMDTSLIPSTSGSARTLLETQRASVAAHLDQARRILNTL